MTHEGANTSVSRVKKCDSEHSNGTAGGHNQLSGDAAIGGRTSSTDQDGTTHFKATLTEYEGKYEGFPYVGLFTLVALIAVGSYFGYELALEYEMYLENDSWPTLMEYIGDKLP